MGWYANYTIILRVQKGTKILPDFSKIFEHPPEKCHCCDDVIFNVTEKYGRLNYLHTLMSLVAVLVEGKFITITGKYSGNGDFYELEPPTTLTVENVKELNQESYQKVQKEYETYKETVLRKKEEEGQRQHDEETRRKEILRGVEQKLEKIFGIESISQYIMKHTTEGEYASIESLTADNKLYNSQARFIIHFLSIYRLE